MNKRVFNALRKIAGGELRYDGRKSFDHEYWNSLPVKPRGDLPEDLLATKTYAGKETRYMTLNRLRELQAAVNARQIVPEDSDLYYPIRRHLKTYGETKETNFNAPLSIYREPLPVFDDSKLNKRQRELLREAEYLQVNNRRNNPYSKTV